MWIVLATFALCFGITYGLYWLVVDRADAESLGTLATRLTRARASRTDKASAGSVVKETTSASSIRPLDAALERAGAVTGRMQRLIDAADVKLTVGRLVLASALLGATTYLVLSFLLNSAGIALLVAPVAASAPYLWLRWKRASRLRLFEEQFPDAIDFVARAMRAGHGLTAGLGMVGDEVAAPVGPAFKQVYDWQNFGMSLPEALQKFAERTPLLDARFFVTAVLTQRESGGNLSEVLDNLARVIRERFQVKRQIAVVAAHGKITGLVLGCMPPALATYFMVVDPKYLGSMIADPLGIRLLLAAVVLQIVGVLIIRKIIDVEY
jgi:tight adherence protein B